MKCLLSAASLAVLILIPTGTVRAQYDGISPGYDPGQNLTQEQQLILQNNQNLNYRTNQQIFNRRVNNSLSECSQPEFSPSCQQALPETDSWKTNGTLQDVQNLRIRTIQGEP